MQITILDIIQILYPPHLTMTSNHLIWSRHLIQIYSIIPLIIRHLSSPKCDFYILGRCDPLWTDNTTCISANIRWISARRTRTIWSCLHKLPSGSMGSRFPWPSVIILFFLIHKDIASGCPVRRVIRVQLVRTIISCSLAHTIVRILWISSLVSHSVTNHFQIATAYVCPV